MWHQRIIPLLALIGLCGALLLVYKGRSKPPVPKLLYELAQSPYAHSIACDGTIEAFSENLHLDPTFPELITEVYHGVNDHVKKDEPLFKLDTRRYEAELKKAQEEEFLAQTDLALQELQFSYYERLQDKTAVSQLAYTNSFFELELAKNRLNVAKAAVQILKTQIERSLIRAPFSGTILQAGHARVGEFANVNPFDNVSLMVLGSVEKLNVRIEIDEVEAWRYTKGAPAVAFVRGNPRIRIPLTFEHIEPYMIPKKTLVGSNAERVDTRILQVIYTLDSSKTYPVYVGQVLDIFIETQPWETS
jgi:RND family efflux transporter MFP subunit